MNYIRRLLSRISDTRNISQSLFSAAQHGDKAVVFAGGRMSCPDEAERKTPQYLVSLKMYRA